MSFGNDRVLKAKLFEGVSSKRNYADVLTGFENGITKLIGYSDGTTRPTGVFGGSATNLTKAANSVNPIENSFSLKLGRTAAAQGKGYYFDFTPMRKHKLAGASLNIKFALELLTGTFSGSVNPSVDSDFIIGVWDMANNKNIEPGNRLLEPMVTNFIYKYQSSFQIPINATTLRVYIHSATTNSAAFEINIDDLEISEPQIQNITMRPPVGTIISYGSITPPVGFLYCDGSAISRTQYAKLFQAIGTGYGVGDGSTTFNLPNAKGVFLRGAGTQVIGGENRIGTIGTTENDQFQGHRHGTGYADTNAATTGPSGLMTFHSSATQNTQGPRTDAGTIIKEPVIGINGAPRVGAETRPANITVAYHICFDDGVASVADQDFYNSTVICYSLNADTAANSAILKYDKKLTDRYSLYNPLTGQLTCPFSGTAKVMTKNFSTSNVTELQIRKSGVNQARGGDGTTANDQSSTVIAAFDIEAGNVIDIFNNTTATFYAGANDNILIIELEPNNKISYYKNNPHACKYYTTAGQTFSGTPQRVNFGTIKYDNAGLVQVGIGVWEFTAKESGVYETLGNITRSGLSQNSDFSVNVLYNGIVVDNSYSYLQLSVGNNQYVQQRICTEDYLLAGQKIWLEIRDPNGGSLTTNAYDNWVAIRKVS